MAMRNFHSAGCGRAVSHTLALLCAPCSRMKDKDNAYKRLNDRSTRRMSRHGDHQRLSTLYLYTYVCTHSGPNTSSRVQTAFCLMIAALVHG